MQKRIRRKINGILLLDKPVGITSNAALQRIKHLYQAEKAGHSGSLDPLASGMLPILLGDATKFSQFLLDADKTYEVVATLGVKTTTGDAEGDVVERRSVPHFTRSEIEQALSQFRGEIDQIPPMYSAVKHQGQPLYKLARQGIEVERTMRKVYVHALELRAYDETTLSLYIHCTKGTYVRTLIEDLGNVLGCGASVGMLRRPTVHFYQAEEMQTMASLETLLSEAGMEALDKILLPVDSLIRELPAIHLTSLTARYIQQGQAVFIPQLPEASLVRLFLPSGGFLGVGELLDDGRVAPKRLISSH